MRKLLILIILVLFGAYCVQAHRAQGIYALPEYALEEVNILGGATPTHWQSEAYATERYERLLSLEKRRLQPAETISLSGGRTLTPDRELRIDDYRALVEAGKIRLTLRDPSTVRSFADRGLIVRQDVLAADGTVLAPAGAVLQKPLVDRLLSSGVDCVPVVGKGEVVGVNATWVMVVLVFIGMTLTLQEVFWEPVKKHLDARKAEVNAGVRAVRENEHLAERLERERTETLRAIQEECQERVSAARQKAMRESETILAQTREKMKVMRQDADRKLEKSLSAAETELKRELPEFAAAIVKKVTGREAS